jgi:hypothetical protein
MVGTIARIAGIRDRQRQESQSRGEMMHDYPPARWRFSRALLRRYLTVKVRTCVYRKPYPH